MRRRAIAGRSRGARSGRSGRTAGASGAAHSGTGNRPRRRRVRGDALGPRRCRAAPCPGHRRAVDVCGGADEAHPADPGPGDHADVEPPAREPQGASRWNHPARPDGRPRRSSGRSPGAASCVLVGRAEEGRPRRPSTTLPPPSAAREQVHGDHRPASSRHRGRSRGARVGIVRRRTTSAVAVGRAVPADRVREENCSAQLCAVGRTTISPTSTPGGCSRANTIARPTASGGMAISSRRRVRPSRTASSTMPPTNRCR